MRTFLTTAAAFFLLAPIVAAQKTATQKGDTITTNSGLKYIITKHGKGAKAEPGKVVVAHYTGTFLDGKVFDSSRERNEPFGFKLGEGKVIAGWEEGFSHLRVGDRATFIIPPELAYGSETRGPIPGGSTLVFDVELLSLADNSLSDVVTKTIREDGIDEAVKQYKSLKKRKFPKLYTGQQELNIVGYQLLSSNRIADAITIFKLNVEAYPKSSNVYDSLGEAYMNNGDNQLAIDNYKKSLELDPDNQNAKNMLEKLGK